jgi:hypothetical protein
MLFSNEPQPDEMPLRRPEGVSIDTPLPTVGEVFRAAAMSSSMMVALAQRLAREEFPPEPNYSPAKFVTENPQYEGYRDRFLDSRSHMETVSIAGRIDRELAWAQTKASAGTAGVIADLVMGNADPTIFLPVAGAVRAARGGVSVARTAAAVGVSGAAGVAIQEGALQAQQETRSLSESAINVGTATLLAGFLGGAAGSFLGRAERRVLEAAMDRERAFIAAHAAGDKDAPRILDTPGPTETGPASGNAQAGPAAPAEAIPAATMSGPQSGDAGAALTDARPMERVEALGSTINRGAQRIIDAEIPVLSSAVDTLMNLSDRFGPMQRAFGARSISLRRNAGDLVEYPGLFKQNQARELIDADGNVILKPDGTPLMAYETTTSTGGPAVERSVKLALNQSRVALADKMDELYQDLRYTERGQEVPGLVGRSLDSVNDFLGRSPDDVMDYKAFSKEVSIALSNGDQHAIPQVAAAAQWIRQNIFKPWLDRAIAAKLLTEDARNGVVGAESYFHRIYNKEMLRSRPEQFIRVAMDHLRADQAEKRALQEQAQWLNAQRNSFEDDIARLNGRLARLEEATKQTETRFDEASKALARGERRENVLTDRAGEAAAEISEIEEFVDAMKASIKDPALLARLQLLSEEATRLKKAERASEISPAKMRDIEEQELQGILTGPEKEVAEIVVGRRKPAEPPSFISYLVKEGGVKDPGGDVRSIIGGAQSRPGLIDNKGGRSLDEWGEKLTQDYPGFFPERPTPQQVEEFISEAARGRQPSWWMDALPEEQRLRLDVAQSALAMQEVLHRAGVEPNNVREVAKLMRDGRTSGGVTLADLDRVASEMQAVGQVVPPSFERAATQENLGVAQEGIRATREIIRKAQAASEARGRALDRLTAQRGEVQVAETATRGRLGILLDRMVRAEAKRELIQDALAIGQRHVDEIRGKIEDVVGKWHGESSKEAKAAIKAREKYIKENRTDAAGNVMDGPRLTMADDAVDKSIARMIAAHKNLDDGELRSLAEQIHRRILGSPDGRLPYDIEQGGPTGNFGQNNPEARGALNQRSYAIPDNVLHENGFLMQDVEEVATAYTRTMMPDVMIAERYGDVRMTEAFRQLDDDYARLQREAAEGGKSEKYIRDLEKEHVAAIRDLAAMRDRIRMVYGWSPESIVQNAARIANSVAQWNVLTSMGMSAVSSLPDVAGIIMRHGAEKVFGDAWRPFFEGLSAKENNVFKEAKRQYRAMGIAIEVSTGARRHSLDDIADTYRPQSRVERTLSGATDKFMIANGQSIWTDHVKTIASIVSGNEILAATKALVEGTATARQLTNLGESNITPALARKIHKEFFERGFGEIKDGVHLPNTRDWEDIAARNAFEGAVAREADIAVVTPGQEKSLWMSLPVLSLVGQFKSFIGSSTERVLIANLQRRDAFTLQGTFAALALGMMSYKANSLAGGQPTSDKPADWFKEGISRSGLLGWFEEGNAISSKMTGGAMDVYRLIGADKPLSRYASRSAIDAFLGPTVGKAANIAKVTSAAGRAITGADEWTGSDTRAWRQLMAGQNMVWFRNTINAVERGVNDMLGIENLPANK